MTWTYPNASIDIQPLPGTAGAKEITGNLDHFGRAHTGLGGRGWWRFRPLVSFKNRVGSLEVDVNIQKYSKFKSPQIYSPIISPLVTSIPDTKFQLAIIHIYQQ